MVTGFVDRFKGKVTLDAGAQWIAGTPLYGPASVQIISSLTAGVKYPNSSVIDGSSVTNYGITIINSSNVGGVVTMQPPNYIGQFKLIMLTTIGASTIFIKSASTATVTFNGSSFFVIKSTLGASALEFVAYSSIAWALSGVQNSSASHTLSTST